jgi:surface polysaccharide O-acyltransferase-like enzyme
LTSHGSKGQYLVGPFINIQLMTVSVIKPTKFFIAEYISIKLKFFSMALMLMVVFLHSYNLDIGLNFKSHLLDYFLQNFISSGITAIAVPLFFIISGFLFFLNRDSITLSWYWDKYRKRSRSLLVPYLLWSLWGMALLFLLQLVPASRGFFHSSLQSYSLSHILYLLAIKPVPYQLWFVRDLLLLVLAAPFVEWGIKYTYGVFVLFAAGLWLANIDLKIISTLGLFFFTFGAFIAIRRFNFPIVEKVLKTRAGTLFIVWILLISAVVLSDYYNYLSSSLSLLLGNMTILLGLAATWYLYDRYFLRIHQTRLFLALLGTISPFFIFGLHEPLLSILKRGSLHVLGYSEPVRLLVYLLAPIIILIVIFSVGIFLKNRARPVYAMLTGGR